MAGRGSSGSGGGSGSGPLLTKRQEAEKAKQDFERKQRQLQTELAEWRVKFRESDKQREDERKGRLKVEEQLSQSGAYLKECLAKADAERKKQLRDAEAKHADDRKEWDEKHRREEERRQKEETARVALERAEREAQLKAAVREAESRAVREYESQFGKAFIDQEEKARESAEIIRKFRDDLVDKANEQKKLLEANVIKDQQIRALREQHEYDAKQQRIAKQTEANLLRYKSLVKYLALYKYIKDFQLRKRVIALHGSTLDLVALLIRDQSLATGADASGGYGGYGSDAAGGSALALSGGAADTARQSEIEAWYASSRALAKHFSGNKLLLALSDAQHVLHVTLRDVMAQLARSRAEMESMLERVSDLTNICMAHEHEHERLQQKNRSERAKYHSLAEAYTALDRAHHSLQKKLNQMVEYAQLHSGRTHHAGVSAVTASASASAAAAGPAGNGLAPLHMTSPQPGAVDGGAAPLPGMTPTTVRVASSNPFTLNSESAGGRGWSSPRSHSPIRAGSAAAAAAAAGNPLSPRQSGHVPAHVHFQRSSGRGPLPIALLQAQSQSGAKSPRAMAAPGPAGVITPVPPLGPKPGAGATADHAKEQEPVGGRSAAVTAPSWFSPSKRAAHPAAAAAAGKDAAPPTATPDADTKEQPQNYTSHGAASGQSHSAHLRSRTSAAHAQHAQWAQDDDDEDRAAATRIAELKAWLSRAGKLKPKLWQQNATASHSSAGGGGAAAATPAPVMAGGHGLVHTAQPPQPLRLPGQRPKSAYSPRTFPTTGAGDPSVPHKLRVTPGAYDPTSPTAIAALNAANNATSADGAAAASANGGRPQAFVFSSAFTAVPPADPKAQRERELSNAYGQPVYPTPQALNARAAAQHPARPASRA